MEYPGTCHAIRQIELLPKLLVRNDMAEIVKDEVTADGKVQVRVYHVFVGEELTPVNVRFWYDKRYDKASFKLTEVGIDAILQSGTVIAGLMRLGKSVSKNGNGFSMEGLEDLLKTALRKLEEEKIIKEDM